MHFAGMRRDFRCQGKPPRAQPFSIVLRRTYLMRFLSSVSVYCTWIPFNVIAMSVSEISQRLGIAKPNITPLADRLIADGLAERQRDPADRRVVNIHIRPEGTEKLLAIRENLVQQVNDWSERFTHAELKELDKSVSSVIRILSRINE